MIPVEVGWFWQIDWIIGRGFLGIIWWCEISGCGLGGY